MQLFTTMVPVPVYRFVRYPLTWCAVSVPIVLVSVSVSRFALDMVSARMSPVVTVTSTLVSSSRHKTGMVMM